MRGPDPPVSEAELHGFVDGDIERGRREAVQAFLAASPGDAARVETWRRQNETIRAAFASFETGPLRWSLPLAPGAGGVAATGHAAGGRAEASGSHSWRGRWFARLIGLSFASGALLAVSVAYLAGRVNAPEAASPSSGGPTPAGMNDTFVTRAMAALRPLERPPTAAPRSPNSDGPGQDAAAPILPNLLVDGLKLAGVRAIPGDQGQMLCLVYARPDEAKIALCAEKASDPGESVSRVSGHFPSGAISWRQKGANYALVGALPEPELRALADRLHAQVAAFDAR
ncbi:MAG: anti-sigma factor family protein [Methylocella sp.]